MESFSPLEMMKVAQTIMQAKLSKPNIHCSKSVEQSGNYVDIGALLIF